jgi:hypothetical protein
MQILMALKSVSDKESIESYHFSIKLGFQCPKPELLKDKEAIKDMID